MGSCPDTDIDPKCAFFFLILLRIIFAISLPDHSVVIYFVY